MNEPTNSEPTSEEMASQQWRVFTAIVDGLPISQEQKDQVEEQCSAVIMANRYSVADEIKEKMSDAVELFKNMVNQE